MDNNTISITHDKLQAIYAECVRVRKSKYLSKRSFQSLLLYIQKCVKPSRIFVNRILALFRQSSHSNRIHLTSEFYKDIDWFLTFLPSFNGISFIKKNVVDPNQTLYLDACLTGMGAVWRDRVYATSIQNLGGLNLQIVHLEMLNIVLALRTWGSYWCHSAISIHCDNFGVVCVVKTGKTKDPFLALCIRNIWLLTAHHDIDLQIHHIPGSYNIIADALSRIYSNTPVNYNILRELEDNYMWEHIPSTYFDLDLHL